MKSRLFWWFDYVFLTEHMWRLREHFVDVQAEGTLGGAAFIAPAGPFLHHGRMG
jgi:hypothetical protein